MGLLNIGQRLLGDALPAWVKGGERAALPSAAALQGTRAADHYLSGGLDRSAVDQIAGYNQELLTTAPDRLKLKYEHMAISPRRFMTGQPDLYTDDMRIMLQQKGPFTALQGDLHLKNFGPMVGADGKMRLRLNDFDMGFIGPVQFDVNRLATHIVLTAQENGMSDKQAVRLVKQMCDSYHETLQKLAKHPNRAIALDPPPRLAALMKKANQADEKAWIEQEAPLVKGRRALVRDDLNKPISSQAMSDLKTAFETYRAGLPPDAARELAPYRLTDAVDNMEGTGSMGSQRYRLLLETPNGHRPIVLQMKEQAPPALEGRVPVNPAFPSEAARNVIVSNVMDGGLSPFRSSVEMPMRAALKTPSFLVERVMPGEDVISNKALADPKMLEEMATYYGAVTAVGHAQGAQLGLAGPKEILASLGDKHDFKQGLVVFGDRYAKVVTKDYKDFKKAIARDPLLSSRTVGQAGGKS